MAASKGVEIAVGENGSIVMIGGAKVEVSADGNKVTAYTSGVETRAATAGGATVTGTHIDVSTGFNAVVLNGVTIEQSGDGHLVITAPGKVFVKGNESKPQVGDKMQDGTIYAGISPDTHQPMYTTPADAPLTMKWKAAMQYAEKLDAHDHRDWRVPTKGELNVLWENRDEGALKGTFNVSGSNPAGWYWSSTEDDSLAWGQRFSDGFQLWYYEYDVSTLRCVR
jgi:Protein of unknown function (DUF1566)